MIKNVFYLSLFIFMLSMIMPMESGYAAETGDPVDHVNPHIGNIGHLLKTTYPGTYLPHGNVWLVPGTNPGFRDRYLADQIYSFPIGPISINVTTGDVTVDQKKNASLYDHDFETATPYYYSVLLEDTDITVEYTVSENSAFYRFTFPKGAQQSNILLRMNGDAEIEIAGNDEIEGGLKEDQRRGRYFYAAFRKPFKVLGTWGNNKSLTSKRKISGEGVGGFVTYSTLKGESVEMKIAVSQAGIKQAKKYLKAEMPDWDFEKAKQRARDIWNKELGRIKITGGTKSQRTIFYTSLYRTMWRKGNVWDTYRCAYPLQTIIEPEVNMQVLRDFVRTYEESGWLPSSGAMIGNHATPVFLDAYVKGLRDFDVAKAYEGMKKNHMKAIMIPWRDRGPTTELEEVYFKKGFFPALALGEKEWIPQIHDYERRQSVSVTLEHCYDDWCLAQMAKMLGKDDDHAYFMKRAHNYQILFDERTGFMAPKTADGNWVFADPSEFDPIWSGGQGGRDYYAEMNAWSYTFHVQHDIAGLINLIGGREKFVERLDGLFREQFGKSNKFTFAEEFPDMTGLIGQYAQGNEPSLHIPYLYNYAGAPWKTQRRLRQIMEVWYNDGPTGICGDEDWGSMTSWYVFSSMGFYPVCPGRGIYDIGSPLFEKVELHVGKDKTFVVEAKNVSAQNKYIQSAHLNGKELKKPWFTHADLKNGGSLVLHMGPRPNKAWGSDPEHAAPSMSPLK